MNLARKNIVKKIMIITIALVLVFTLSIFLITNFDRTYRGDNLLYPFIGRAITVDISINELQDQEVKAAVWRDRDEQSGPNSIIYIFDADIAANLRKDVKEVLEALSELERKRLSACIDEDGESLVFRYYTGFIKKEKEVRLSRSFLYALPYTGVVSFDTGNFKDYLTALTAALAENTSTYGHPLCFRMYSALREGAKEIFTGSRHAAYYRPADPLDHQDFSRIEIGDGTLLLIL